MPITAPTRPCRVEHEYPHIYTGANAGHLLRQASRQSFEEKTQRSTRDAASGSACAAAAARYGSIDSAV
jgi:hypothetical protein